MKTQAETIADLNARCDGLNQFENFDRAFRATLAVPKAALLKERGAAEAGTCYEEAGEENRLTPD